MVLRKKCLRISDIEEINVDEWVEEIYGQDETMYKLLDSEWKMEGERTFMVITILDKAGVGRRLLEYGYELMWKKYWKYLFWEQQRVLYVWYKVNMNGPGGTGYEEPCMPR